VSGAIERYLRSTAVLSCQPARRQRDTLTASRSAHHATVTLDQSRPPNWTSHKPASTPRSVRAGFNQPRCRRVNQCSCVSDDDAEPNSWLAADRDVKKSSRLGEPVQRRLIAVTQSVQFRIGVEYNRGVVSQLMPLSADSLGDWQGHRRRDDDHTLAGRVDEFDELLVRRQYRSRTAIRSCWPRLF
jgi:hypothetical protein